MTAFEHQTLFGKASLVLSRAIAARQAGDLQAFGLWAATSLELVGKAALASIHPALVADPQHVDSLLAACGKPIGVERRTITAKTVFTRLAHVDANFDKTHQDFCMSMAERRNSDLHSGELPFEGLKPEVWVPTFWSVISILVKLQGRTLEQLVGAQEAVAAEQIVKQHLDTLAHMVADRIAKCTADFDRHYSSKEAIAAMREASKGGRLVPIADFRGLDGDFTDEEECPACQCTGLISGEVVDEEIIDTDVGYDDEGHGSPFELVRTTYSSLAFRCGVCRLRLDGIDEIRAADMREELEQTDTREPSYEPDYGND